MPDDNIQILYDHYKDTYAIIEKTIVKRDRYFIFAILLVFASTVLTLSPEFGIKVVQDIGKEKLKVNLSLSYFALNSAILFAGIWYWIRYFQNVLQVENLYIYIHKLEETLCATIKLFEISREGKSYLNQYPILKSFIHRFYTIFAPMFLIIISGMKGYHELFIEAAQVPKSVKVFDIIGVCILIVSTGLYLSWIHFKDFKKS